MEYITNKKGERFYVGDIVRFEGAETQRCIGEIEDKPGYLWRALGEKTCRWIPDNLVLIHRPVPEAVEPGDGFDMP